MLTLDPMFHKVVASGSNIESSVDRIKKARAETSNGITEQVKGHGGKDAEQKWGYPSSSTGLQVSRVRKKRWCKLRRSMYWEANGHYCLQSNFQGPGSVSLGLKKHPESDIARDHEIYSVTQTSDNGRKCYSKWEWPCPKSQKPHIRVFLQRIFSWGLHPHIRYFENFFPWER